ncbi:MAG: hypothetical protein AB7K71_39810 [Polyangiaceae bacterium]
MTTNGIFQRCLLMTGLLLAFAGCQRKVCDESVVGQTPRLSEPTGYWKEHPELLPEHVVTCTGDSANAMQSVNVDFDPEPAAPVPEINKRLEAAKWTRMEQKETGMGYQLQYRKGNERIVVSTITGHKRTHAMYSWEKLPDDTEHP